LGAGVQRRDFIGVLSGTVVAWPLVARAQQIRKVSTIGFITAGQGTPSLPAFLEALRKLGWVEGKNLAIAYRYAQNNRDQLRDMAAELVRLNVDVIVAVGTLAPLAAKQATTTIPIIMTSGGDPLGTGLVTGLARPGGNVTGLSLMMADIGAKWLELLKELVPATSRVAVLWNSANPYPADVFRVTKTAAGIMGIKIQSLEVKGPSDFDGAFEAVKSKRPDALITIDDPLMIDNRSRIVEFAAAERLPTIHGVREFVKAGGLMSYGASISDLYRRAADYVDKVLKGARPADLPVEQPTKFEFVINLGAARALGITMPPNLLARADEVIE
jgi:putative tryptophan/tyrosine transport system substrate-binding protein